MANHIVIVEDDQAIAQMYQIKLETLGHSVQIAENGRLGLALIQERQPDVVLLDLMMPEMNGHEMLTELRKTDWGKDIKVIVLTNVGESEIAASIEGLGISGLIIKAQSTPSQVAEQVKSLLDA